MVRLSSSAFEGRTAIPDRYTCEGQNVSPPLDWDGVPDNTKSLVLILDDPDAPNGPFTHWVVYNISPQRNHLPEQFAPSEDGVDDIEQGRNDFGHTRYEGPCPPRGDNAHHYHFRLYALDADLSLPPGANRDQIFSMIHNHILGQTELVGTYERSAGI